MISMLKFGHCDPSGIAINSSKSNDFKDCAPHRPSSRALDSVEGFPAAPAPQE